MKAWRGELTSLLSGGGSWRVEAELMAGTVRHQARWPGEDTSTHGWRPCLDPRPGRSVVCAHGGTPQGRNVRDRDTLTAVTLEEAATKRTLAS